MKSITRLYNRSQGDHKPPEEGDKVAGNDRIKRLRKSDHGKVAHKRSHSITIDEKVRMIVHEIRNPLTAISLANQSLSEQISSDDTKAVKEIIHKNVDRIESLLKQILQVNSANKFPLVKTDIAYVLQNSLEMAEDRIFLKKIDLIVTIDSGLMVLCNAQQLSLAFLNIIINAVEAVKREKGRIWITAYQLNDLVKLIIKDNGAGMEPEVAMQMFDKNFSGKPKGIGVGLGHVKEILEWHDATISVHSEPGTGTSFVIALKRYLPKSL